MEKRKRMGMSVPGETLTREERQARIWAFMCVLLPFNQRNNKETNLPPRNHKPTDSDLEDDDEDEYDDDDDPASWFEDDQDDGRKGQLIVEPDEEDYGDIIRIDASKLPSQYSMFYEPRDEGD